ncbi:DUF58 domain-containing protein [Eubacteriales bacterium KG125]
MKKDVNMKKNKSININFLKITLIVILCLTILLFSDWHLTMTLALALIFLLMGELIAVCISGSKVTLKVEMPESMIKDQTESIYISIVNGGILPLPTVKIRLKLTNVYTGEVIYDELKIGLIPGFERTEHLYLRANHVGVVKAKCLEISTYGFLKIAEKHIKFSENISEVQGETVIYPDVDRIASGVYIPESHDIESFKYAENKAGNDSSEIMGIRSMRSQDSLKLIHWKLSAKLSEPVVKELSYPVDSKVMIIFDAMGFDSPKLADKAVEKLAEISLSMSKHHISHGISWYDERLNTIEIKTIDREEDFYITLSKVMEKANRENSEAITPFTKMEGYSGYIVITRNRGLIERMRHYGTVTGFKINESE